MLAFCLRGRLALGRRGTSICRLALPRVLCGLPLEFGWVLEFRCVVGSVSPSISPRCWCVLVLLFRYFPSFFFLLFWAFLSFSSFSCTCLAISSGWFFNNSSPNFFHFAFLPLPPWYVVSIISVPSSAELATSSVRVGFQLPPYFSSIYFHASGVVANSFVISRPCGSGLPS